MASCGAQSLPCLSGLQDKGLQTRSGRPALPASPVVLKHEGLPGSEVSKESSRLYGCTLRSEP